MSKRMPKRLLAFLGIVLSECAVTVVLLLLLSYFSFRMRFSTEVVRAGITALYLLPCLIGGRLVRTAKFQPALLWGAGAGAAFYGILLVLSVCLQGAGMSVAVPVLCVAGAAAGSLQKRGTGRKSELNT